MNKRSKALPRTFLKFRFFELAAIAVDLREQLTPQEIAKTPSLSTVLDACDSLFEELGWGAPSVAVTKRCQLDTLTED